MNLYGLNLPLGKDLENQVRKVFSIAFPNGEAQVEAEALPIREKLRDYPFTEIKAMYVLSACLYWFYLIAGNGVITRIDEANLFITIRDAFNMPRIDMIKLYGFLKEKPEINPSEEERFKGLFKERMVGNFDSIVQELLTSNFYNEMSGKEQKMTLEMIIVNTWSNFMNNDYSDIIKGTKLSQEDL